VRALQTVDDAKPSQSNKRQTNANVYALPEFLHSQPMVLSSVPIHSPSMFNTFLQQNPAVAAVNAMDSSLILPAFSGMNLPTSSTFTFSAAEDGAQQPNTQLPIGILVPMPVPTPEPHALPQPRPLPPSQPEDTGSIAANFLKKYYEELHSSPATLKKFYHADANIDHDVRDPAMGLDTSAASRASRLGVFEGGVTFVDITTILNQNAANHSIMVRVNGTMHFEKYAARQFEQILLISKSGNDFWLIYNDMFWLVKNQKMAIAAANTSAQPQRPQGFVPRQQSSQQMQNRRNDTNHRRAVNDSMVNRYYHDTSYQCFDNSLAVFIRPIPNTLTHANLAELLKEYVVGVSIAYIDVNYHKQFAFVYFQDRRSFESALECGEIFINGASAQIQVKRSRNAPRTFGFPRRQ